MTKAVKILLIIAGALFVGGIIWAIVATSRNNKQAVDATKTTPTAQTTITTSTPQVTVPAPSETPAPVPTNPTPQTPPKTKQYNRNTTTTYYYYTYEEPTYETYESSSSAWARAGVNDDGTTYAESHAE
jgi:hypothetical protein